jgi:hypothetical protein
MVEVNFGVYVFGAGTNQFFHVGTQQVTVPGNTTITASQPWTPMSSSHQCVQVSLAYGLDTNFDNNATQRNLQVAPSVYEVEIRNPFPVPAVMELEARSNRDGWRCHLEDTRFVLDPMKDCPRTVEVTFDAPQGAREGEYADCDLGVFATPRTEQGERRLIGGVTLRTFVPERCRVVGQVVDARLAPLPGVTVAFGEGVTTKTDEEGIFSAELTPYRPQAVTVAGRRFERRKAELRLQCGVGLRLVLTGRQLEVEQGFRPVEPRLGRKGEG